MRDMEINLPYREQEEQLSLIKSVLITIKHFFGEFDVLFGRVEDHRNQAQTEYPLPCIFFTAIFMFLCRLGARRQITHQLRNNGPSAEKFHELFGVCTIPHSDTVNEVFKRLDVEQVQQVVCCTIANLIRKKVLSKYRLFGHYMIAVDGTGMLTYHRRHCDHCLTKRLNNGDILYYHHVLEAKIVTNDGFVFSVMTEFVENPESDCSVQDCELKAFYRLTQRLKTRFPRLPICLLLDGLFANGPTFSLCQNYRWKFITTLKNGSLPSVNQEFVALSDLLPENNLQLQTGKNNQILQQFSWVNAIPYQDSFGHQHHVSVFQCRETKPNFRNILQTTTFQWITNFQLSSQNIVILANKGGRLRWKIENEGFNIQKNGGFQLEHGYSQNINSCKIFYLLMQIAHTFFQLIERGSFFRNSFPRGVGSSKNIAFRLLEAWRNLRLERFTLVQITSGRFQIRFDTS